MGIFIGFLAALFVISWALLSIKLGARIGLMIAFFGVSYTLLAFNMYNLQIKQGSYFDAKAEIHHKLTGVLSPKRGSIYFTDKDDARIPIAINKEYPNIYAVPKEINNPEFIAEVLSDVSDRTTEDLISVLSKEGDPYEQITKRSTDEEIKNLNIESLEGVYIDKSYARFYPLDNIASHLIGYSSIIEDQTGRGVYGVEEYNNDELQGTPGEIDGDKLIRPINGEDVYLTIDRNIQVRAEEIIENLIEGYNAVGGTVIVENPKTGEILAMTSKPDFNPNKYKDADIGDFLNPATQSIYEPGSIFKVLTMAAGIDSNSITPDTTFYDSGSLSLDGYTIHNWDLKAHGEVTMTNVIEKSLNTGAAFAQRQMGRETFYKYLVDFGFKTKTDIDLPSEIVGSLSPLENNPRDINYATASFGQGISVTPMGLMRAMSALANNGVMMQPYINRENSPKEIRRVIKASTSRQVKEMMVSAVDKAIIPTISGYSVAGKTGTAQVPNFNTGGYTDEVINTYIGFAPAYDPQFVILVRLDKPAGAPLAGRTVVPAFRELAEFIINYYNIPPDRPGE